MVKGKKKATNIRKKGTGASRVRGNKARASKSKI
jgi:hypothetical protein